MQSHYPSSGMVMTKKLEQQRMLAKILRYCNLQTLLVGIKHSTAIKKKKFGSPSKKHGVYHPAIPIFGIYSR